MLVLSALKLLFFPLFPFYTLWKEVTIHSPHLRRWSLRMQYLHKLFAIVLMADFSFPPYSFICSIITSIRTHGYFILCYNPNSICCSTLFHGWPLVLFQLAVWLWHAHITVVLFPQDFLRVYLLPRLQNQPFLQGCLVPFIEGCY